MVLDWLQEVALTPEGQDYKNPEFEIVYADPIMDPIMDDDVDWSEWKDDEKMEGEKNGNDESQVKVKPVKVEPEETSGKGSNEPGLVLVTRPAENQVKEGDGENGEKHGDASEKAKEGGEKNDEDKK